MKLGKRTGSETGSEKKKMFLSSRRLRSPTRARFPSRAHFQSQMRCIRILPLVRALATALDTFLTITTRSRAIKSAVNAFPLRMAMQLLRDARRPSRRSDGDATPTDTKRGDITLNSVAPRRVPRDGACRSHLVGDLPIAVLARFILLDNVASGDVASVASGTSPCALKSARSFPEEGTPGIAMTGLIHLRAVCACPPPAASPFIHDTRMPAVCGPRWSR